MVLNSALYSLLVLFLMRGVEAQDVGCYSAGSMAGIVISTIVATLVMGGLASAFLWYLWKQRKGVSQELAEKDAHAFDNPYFKEENAAEKGESGFRLGNGGITQPNVQPSTGEQRPGHHTRSSDDATQVERVSVPLRGHDFTGLGFNICGNMRDGIFVRDVLLRGPAYESRNIKAGDKLLGVFVSFSGMVYEDAVTILSYASPYDVRLEVEKSSTTPRHTSTGGLFHPLYRSQSADDLLTSPGTQKSQRESFVVPKIPQTSISKRPAKSGDDESPLLKPFSSVNLDDSQVEKNEENLTMNCILTNEKLPKLLDEQLEEDKPIAPPRTPKRRAPAPPPPPAKITESEAPPPPTSELPLPSERSDLEYLSCESPAHHQNESPEKRKASSLGDLTKHKASISPAILERAVSLDLQQQSIPGENLVKQKKVLKAPSFDCNCEENREEVEVTGLKRWEDEFLGLENGIEELSEVTQSSELNSSGRVTNRVDEDSPEEGITAPPINIPIIKPDLTNFEKLPSPPPAVDWRVSKLSDEVSKAELEKISVQSLYKPIFSSKEAAETTEAPNNAAGFAKTLIDEEMLCLDSSHGLDNQN